MSKVQTARMQKGVISQPRDDDQDKEGNKGIEEWLVEDLHDMVAQPLWYLAIELSSLHRDLSPDLAGLRERLEALDEVAQEAYQQLRMALGWARRPNRPCGTIFEEVQHQVQSFEKQSGVEVKLA